MTDFSDIHRRKLTSLHWKILKDIYKAALQIKSHISEENPAYVASEKLIVAFETLADQLLHQMRHDTDISFLADIHSSRSCKLEKRKAEKVKS